MIASRWCISLCAAFALALAGCDANIPTATPTRDVPPLEPSPTFDIRPPTEPGPNVELTPAPGMNIPEAASAPGDGEVFAPGVSDGLYRPQILVVPLEGGQADAELYQGETGAAGVLMVGVPLSDWSGLQATLHNTGFTVLSVEAAMPASNADFAAMINALVTLGGVDENRIGVIGAEMSADFVMIGCAQESRCKTAVLLSPREASALVAVMGSYNPRPLMVAASLDDIDSMLAANSLEQSATGDALIQPLDNVGRGTLMLARRPDLVNLIVTWLGRYLS